MMLIAVTNIYKNFSNVILKRLFQSPTGCSWSRAFHTYMGAQLLHFTALPLKNPCIQLVLGQHSIPVKGQVINIWAFQAILSLTQSLNSTTVAQKQPSKDVVLCANKTLFKKKKKTGSKPDLAQSLICQPWSGHVEACVRGLEVILLSSISSLIGQNLVTHFYLREGSKLCSGLKKKEFGEHTQPFPLFKLFLIIYQNQWL